jgi:hypothetical protein
MEINTGKTTVMAFRGMESVGRKICINDKKLEQITPSVGVTESTLWVPPPQKWIPYLPRISRGQKQSSQTIHGT